MTRLNKPKKMLRFFDKRIELPQGFDEASYLAANADVAAAVSAGKIRSGRAHWRSHGHMEGRPLSPSDVFLADLPEGFDEAAYLELNPDVANNVAKGGFTSGIEHYRRRGYKENRKWQKPPTERSEEFDVTMEDAALRLMPNPLDYRTANPDIALHIGKDPKMLREHWDSHGFKEGRPPYGFTTFKERSTSYKFWLKQNSFAFYGMLDAASGLGRAARHYVSVLERAGFTVHPVVLDEVDRVFETKPRTRVSEKKASPSRPKSKVNIFHLNADVVHRFFADDRRYILDDAYNIAIWVWELAHFRPEWIDASGAFDEIWVPSEFCRAAISAVVSVPIHVVPHAVTVEATKIDDARAYFHLPKDAFLFGAYFDVGSGIERKNPAAVIEAFREAFGDDEHVVLVLKYHSSHHDAEGMRKIHKLCGDLKNVRFIGHVLSDDELSALRGSLDCYVSPHRSEGFGLNVAEAMASGVPVITTLYSGPEDFCDERCVYPIDFRLTELKDWAGPYPKNALWAEPSVGSLAKQMRRVRDNPAEAHARAETAKLRINETNSIDALAMKLKQHIDALELFKPAPAFLQAWGAGREATSHFTDVEDIRFSIITPVYNIAPDLLARCIVSVRRQDYKNWELVLFDDGSTRPETLEALKAMQGADPRIKVAFGGCNRGISAAMNSAVSFSSGAFLAFLDNDDELAPNALEVMARALQANPTADVLYSDEDKLDARGRRCDHYFKPDWSPEHLESVMYLLHLFVVRRSLFLKLGGFREAYTGAQDYDLALRATRNARKVVHVPEILYHWRMIPGSAAEKLDAKPETFERARQALEEHCRVLGRPARVTMNHATGLLRVQDEIRPGLPVTLLILTDNRSADVPQRGRINLIDHFIDSIVRVTKTECELHYLVVDNHNLSDKQVQRIRRLGGRVVSYDGPRRPFNFSNKANFALKHVETDLLVMLNDDLEVITPDWIDALVGLAQRPTTGVVGAKLRFPNETIQHCGVIMGINGHVAHMYHQYPADQIGYNGFTHVIRNYLAVTGAVMATRMSRIVEVGGFDEDLKIDYNDIDLCLKMHTAGYRNIYTPYAELYHFEGTSQNRSEPTSTDRVIFDERWRAFLETDPYFNPNLSKYELTFRPREPATWER